MQRATSTQTTDRVASHGAVGVTLSEPMMTCYNHPDRETGLRCIACDRAICGTCARIAPVGQLCPACRHQRRPVNYHVTPHQLALGGLVTMALAVPAALLMLVVDLGLLSLYVALVAGPPTGAFIVRCVDRVIRAKRGRAVQVAVGGAMIVGMLAVVFVQAVVLFVPGYALALDLWGELGYIGPPRSGMLFGVNPVLICYLVSAVMTAMYRLK